MHGTKFSKANLDQRKDFQRNLCRQGLGFPSQHYSFIINLMIARIKNDYMDLVSEGIKANSSFNRPKVYNDWYSFNIASQTIFCS